MTKNILGITALVLSSSAALVGCGIANHPTAAPAHASRSKSVAAASTPRTSSSTPSGTSGSPTSGSTPTTGTAKSPASSGNATVDFTESGNHVQTPSSTLTVAKGSTVVFSAGNAATAKLVNKGNLVLYGGEILGNSFPANQVPLALGFRVHGWSYKLPSVGTWRFAIVPSNTSATSAPITVAVTVTR